MRFYFQKLENISFMITAHLSRGAEFHNREQRKNLIQLYEDLFSKKITIVNKKLIVSDRSA